MARCFSKSDELRNEALQGIFFSYHIVKINKINFLY